MKEVKRALNKAIVRLAPPVEIEVSVGESGERKSDSREPLLGSMKSPYKNPSDSLEYEDDDENGSRTSTKC